MNVPTYRWFLLIAFALNLVFLALVLADYALWESAYWLPLFIAWAFVMLFAVLVGLFGRPGGLPFGGPVEVRILGTAPVATEAAAAPVPAAAPAAATPPTKDFPFVHNGYTLHTRDVKLKRGGTQAIYFFAKGKPRSGHPTGMPDGYEVGANKKTGLPYLSKVGHVRRRYQAQCRAITPDGEQCRNSSRASSEYCASHKGYAPPALAVARAAKDTRPRVRKAKDTKPSGRHSAHRDPSHRPQCLATTADGAQCRNSARASSSYCAPHRSYHPPATAGRDTVPRVRKAKNTLPRVRTAST